MITIVPHRSAWRDEFSKLARDVRQALGDLAHRIDHIGSTAVPGLAAKDIIDIQVTASAFDPSIQHALERLGYRRLEHVMRDHHPPGSPGSDEDWAKWFFKDASDQRPTNLHVRITGRPNQR